MNCTLFQLLYEEIGPTIRKDDSSGKPLAIYLSYLSTVWMQPNQTKGNPEGVEQGLTMQYRIKKYTIKSEKSERLL